MSAERRAEPARSASPDPLDAMTAHVGKPTPESHDDVAADTAERGAATRPAIVVLAESSPEPAQVEAPVAAPSTAQPAAPPEPIRLDEPWSLAARRVISRHAERLLALDDAIRLPEARDELRRYRVAARRIRAGLQVFDGAFPEGQADGVRRALRDVARRVGTVRDLDVRIADLDGWARSRDGGLERVAPLHSAWTAERDQAFERLLDALDDQHHARLLRRLPTLLGPTGPADPSPVGQGVVADHVAGASWSAYAGLRATGSSLALADATRLHGVRIAAKRLRYTLEFLRDALGPEAQDLIGRLTLLQDRLGVANDAVTTGMAVAAFLGEHADRLADRERRGIVAYQVASLNRLARARRAAPAAWRAVASPTFARRLAAATAASAAASAPAVAAVVSAPAVAVAPAVAAAPVASPRVAPPAASPPPRGATGTDSGAAGS